MTRPPIVAIVSGGLDSSVMAYWLNATWTPLLLSFDYGQRHVKEIACAQRCALALGADHLLIDLRSVGAHLTSALTGGSAVPDGHYTAESMRSTIVPNRNAIMLSIAFGVAAARNIESVAYAAHSGDHVIYPDCRPEFVSAFGRAMRQALDPDRRDSHVGILAPFLYQSKEQIVRIGQGLGVPFAETWSCYKGGQIHCGTCGTCTERREAFERAGVPDPTPYASLERHY